MPDPQAPGQSPVGITVPEESKHTALGDARWAKAIYEAVMGR